MSKASSKDLDDLHGLIARELAAKIKSGEYTAADLNVARQFLKDNNVQSITTPTNPLGALAGALTDGLPFASTGIEH